MPLSLSDRELRERADETLASTRVRVLNTQRLLDRARRAIAGYDSAAVTENAQMWMQTRAMIGLDD